MKIIKFIIIVAVFIFNIKILYAKDTWHYGVKSNDTIIAQISQKEISRINLRGEVIDRLHFVDGEIEFIKEEEDLYLKPLVIKPINIFLKTESGDTYKILLEVVDVPACQIFITKNPKPKKILSVREKRVIDNESFQSGNKEVIAPNSMVSKPSRVKTTEKQKLAAKGEIDRGPVSFEEKRIAKMINILEIEDQHFGIRLKKASGRKKNQKYQITKKMTGKGYGLYAEKYEIKNITCNTQILSEKEFTGGMTRAIYLSQEKLLPEQTGTLIKVYRNEG